LVNIDNVGDYLVLLYLIVSLSEHEK